LGTDASEPLAAEVDKVEPVRLSFAAPTTQDAGVHLVADGAVIRPVEKISGIYRFVVPGNVLSVSLESRSGIRADAVASRKTGSRRLGVRVKTIAIRSDAGEVVMPADDPRLTMGWHDAEGCGAEMWRWTDGSAQLPWTKVAKPIVVSIRCSSLAEYPVHDEIPQAGRAMPGMDNLTSGRRDTDERPGTAPRPAPPELRGAGRTQWCLGMYSSGSTWVFNAIRSVASTLFPEESLIGVYAEALDQLPPGWPAADRLIVKSHHTDEAATALLLQRADRIWISIRDPLDCVASASTYMFPDFESALDAVTRSAQHCERFILDSRCIILRYEDGFIDDPATLDRFAATLSRTLPRQDRDRLFQQTRRKVIETMIQNLGPEDTVDDGFPGHRVHMATQWHTHHVNRTGEIGRWRQTLDRSKARAVQQRLGPWMERFGYLP
jgi:hypothetical protein